MTDRVVVVGASIGGFRTVRELLARGYPGEIVLLGAEQHLPYDRPPLSKQVLKGDWPPEQAMLSGESELDGVDVRLGTPATGLDLGAQEVALATGEQLHYDHLVIATGATPRTLPDTPPGVHTLRTLDDCLAVRADLLRGGPLVVVGAGFIGAEVAATARTLGTEVTVVEALPAPLSRSLGPEVGAMLQRLHEDNGVTVRCGIGVTGFTGAERVTGVRLDDGSVLPAAVVVIGIGVVPNTSWLEESALEVADGVLCDETCRAVGTDNVYAVGDVARWFDPRLGATVRVEHWTNATEQAAVVAHNIARPEEPRSHAAVPYFWSDQYGVKLQMAGAVIAGATTTTVTGPPGKTRQAVLWSADSRLVAAFTVDWPKALAVSRQVIAAGGAPEQVQERLAR